MTVTANQGLADMVLTSGWESRHYLERTPLPVVEAVVIAPGRIVTEYRWAS